MMGWLLVGAFVLVNGNQQFNYQVNEVTQEPAIYATEKACEKASQKAASTFTVDPEIAHFELHCVTFERAREVYFPKDIYLYYVKEQEV